MNQFIPTALRYILICLLIVVAIAINGVRVFLLSAEDYKDDLQNKVRELTELPIEIGSLRAHMRGFDPEIILDDIQILAQDSNEPAAIKLEQMRLRVNLIQLIFTRQLLPSSWLTLVGVKLSIVRKQDGSLSIAGLTSSDSEQPYWLLNGGRYEVLNSHITWMDEQRNASPIEFQDVDLLLKNDSAGQNHEVHFLTALPKKYGESLRISMSFQGDVFEEDNINGIVYVEGHDIILTELMTGEMPIGLKIRSGVGSFKKWSQFENSKLSSMIGSVQAKELILDKQGKQKKSLHVHEMSTQFNVRNKKNGWTLSVTDLLLETDHLEWPSATFSIATDDGFSQIAASIQQLDLHELTDLVRFFTPLEIAQHNLVKNLHLKGMLKNVTFFIDNELSHYAVNGLFNNIGSRAFDGFPEINNLTGSIKGSDESGKIVFNTEKANAHFPELFRNIFVIEQLTGELEWLQTKEKWQIKSDGFILNTKDVQTETNVIVNIPKDEAPVFMDLQASFSNMQNINHVSEYYPVSIMDADVVQWLDKAFVSGEISQGKVLVYGEMNTFPFVDNQGVFEVLYDMNNVELQYNSDWPNLNNVDAEVLFVKNSVMIDLLHAEVHGLNVKHAVLEIPSFASSDHLLVKGEIEGKLIDGLHFLQKTPIHVTADGVLDAITPTGLTQVDLDLNIPLADTAQVMANVVAHLSNSALTVNAIDLNITEVTGDLRFTEQGLFCKNVNAKTLGFPIQMHANSDDFKTIINISGKTDIKHLHRQFDFFDSWILKNQRLKGTTAYQLTLDLPADENKSAALEITSDLDGISVNFPDSLYKSAKEKSSLLVSMELNEKKFLSLFLQYHDDLSVDMAIDKQKNELYSAHIVYGKGHEETLSYQSIAPLYNGIKIQIEREQFDLTKWMAFVDQSESEKNKSALALNEISLITKKLQWKNKAYGSLELAMERLNGQWQGNISSSMANGAFILPVEQTDDEVIKLNMAHLNLTEILKFDFQQENISVDNLPLIEVVSEQLWWNNINLGRLQIATERLADGIRFKRIDVLSNSHKIELNADWVKDGKEGNTDMYGSITTDDFGGFLAQFNFDNDFKESQGKIDFFAEWPGSPYQFSIAAIEAEMDVELNDGRLANIEPGFGRILGLIAMEQWIKRLTLDFGDIYKQGMSFNSITGHFKIAEGKAVTQNLLVDAVPARVFITGDVDLVEDRLNYSMGVIPKSSGALPIAGTIVSSIAGVITQVFTNDYKEGYFFGSQYKVEGQWENIKVTPVHEEDGLLKKTWTGLTDFSWMKSSTE